MAHGVSVNEVPTGVKPAVSTTAGLAVYTGTAPINLGDVTNVNKPVLVSTLAEAVTKMGYVASASWDDWTLLEPVKAHFEAYGVGPIVLINVIDPTNTAHIAHLITEPQILDSDGNTTVDEYGSSTPLFGILKSTVVVKYLGATKALGTDYTLAFDDDGFLVVSRVSTGTIAALAHITVTCTYLDPSGVVADDIIGGYTSGTYKGLEVVEQVYPALRLVPGFILAPKWSQTPTVAARMGVIAHSINGAFRAMALTDLSTDPDDIASYSAAPAWKSDNGFTAIDSAPCWPKVKNGDDVYHLSTVVACVANVTDATHDGVPFDSPSNKSLVGTSAVLDDGAEQLLTRPQANALNDQGIVTVLNGFNGWKVWGNRTGGYPGTTDPKDAFIPVRRMFNWIENTIVLTSDDIIDKPGNRRLIDSVVGTIGSFLNGLIAVGALVAGKIEFRASENSFTDLSNGKVVFHVTATPPSPAQDIEFTVEYDPAALAALFT